MKHKQEEYWRPHFHAAAAVSSGPTADYPVQLVPIRGAVSVYAVGTHLLAQQR